MANNKIKGLTIQIGADTLGLDEALRRRKRSWKPLPALK